MGGYLLSSQSNDKSIKQEESMKTKLALTALVLFALLLPGSSSGIAQGEVPQAALGTAITYQGRLTDGGLPANSTYDFLFTLYNAELGGSQVGSLVTKNDVLVTDGYFTVQLDFGADAFGNEARWLEVAVRSGPSTGTYTMLNPRQALTPAPTALYAPNAGSVPWSRLTGVPAGFADGIDNDTTYSAGTGLSLSETTFSADTAYLQRRIGTDCSAGYAIRSVNSDGSVVCESVSGGVGDITAVNAGTGLSGGGISGEVTLNADTTYLQRRVDSTCPAGSSISAINSDGTVTCETDNDTTYTAGTGLTLSNGQFSVNTASIQARVSGTCAAGSSVRTVNADGTVVCETDDNTTYTAGTGLTLSGGSFSLVAAYSLPQGCSENQVPKWNGSAWICANDDGGTGSWSLNGNAGTNPFTNYLGTNDNQALALRVNGKQALRLEPTNGTPNIVGGGNQNTVTAGAYGVVIAGGGNNGFPNLVSDDFGTVGGGVLNRAGNSNLATSDAVYATVSGGDANTASGIASTVSGGGDNIASEQGSTVSGGISNTASGQQATVGGGSLNTASGEGSTIAGGGGYYDLGGGTWQVFTNTVTSTLGTIGGGGLNRVTGSFATVSGGYTNNASSEWATVSGGNSNIASGFMSTVGGGGGNNAGGYVATVGGGVSNTSSGLVATISGGYMNQVSGEYATVGGGSYNSADGWGATICGGSPAIPSSPETTNNQVNGDYGTIGGGGNNRAGRFATIPGGANNIASGEYSFAAGSYANATQMGSFVWSNGEATTSWGDNTFTVRAHGGARFYSASGTSTGVQLASGDGSWGSLSDRNAKLNLSPVNARKILLQVVSLPVNTWSYKSQDTSILHMGPMAQDFHAAFGLGDDERYIGSLDADGVSLAAIQGLYQINQEQAVEIQSLKEQLSQMEKASSIPTTYSIPLIWGVVVLLVIAQAGMFIVLRRKVEG